MNNDSSALPALQQNLGLYIRQLRLSQNLTVRQVAETTDLAEKSVRNLESGRGSTTDTLFRVLDAVGAKRLIASLAPANVTGAHSTRMRARSPRQPSNTVTP